MHDMVMHETTGGKHPHNAARLRRRCKPIAYTSSTYTPHGGLWSGQVLGVCNEAMVMGVITKTRDAPQARNVLSWR